MVKLPSLHCNSEYSFQQSTIRLDDLIALAQREKLSALAITDHNNMFGVFEFIAKCKEANIKPLIGLDLDVENYRLVLLARNYDGFVTLCDLSSRKMRGETITAKMIDAQNLFVIDHPTHGCYLQFHQQPAIANFWIPWSSQLPNENLSNVVAISDTRTLTDEDNEAIAILQSQATGEPLTAVHLTPYRFVWDDNESAVKRMVTIIESCNVVIPLNRRTLPTFPNDQKLSSNEYFRQIVNAHFNHCFPTPSTEYRERLALEIDIIERLSFADYFLIIWDLVTWAKKNGIAVGPGRGSSAGSLVAFVLGITEVDPLRYGLLFERFLNHERRNMPDIDIDIQDARRDELLTYVYAKYGSEVVAQISTFSRLGPKSALRDVARVMNFPTHEINALSKLIPSGRGENDRDMTLADAFRMSSRFRAAISASEKTTTLYRRAILLENLPRQHGTHPAGIVISAEKINKHFPTLLSADGFNQVQMSLEYLEENNLLKIDLLSLRNLTILQAVEQLIANRHGRRVNLAKIALDDKLTNELLSSGRTGGLFQLETSYGMKTTLTNVGVDRFQDLVAIISLFRPGPMEQIKTYAARKHNNEQVPVITREYDEITSETYGILVYQEQVMMLARRFASFTFAQADSFRRAISKKQAKGIDDLQQAFIDGAMRNGHSKELAITMFSLIEKFANYGFNKSHAVAYSLLTYRMAYLKARFPLEFFAALINSHLGSQDAVRKYLDEAQELGIEIISPMITETVAQVIIKDNKLVLPLTLIKGFGEVAETKILNELSNGPFIEFFTTILRMVVAGMGEATIAALIKANAMRLFGNVQTLLTALPQAMRYAELNTIINNGQRAIAPILLPQPQLIAQPRQLMMEMSFAKELLGFFLEITPAGKKSDTKLSMLNKVTDQPSNVVVLYSDYKVSKDKKGDDFAIITLVDSTTTITASVFATLWKTLNATPKNSLIRVPLLVENYNGRLTYRVFGPWEVITDD